MKYLVTGSRGQLAGAFIRRLKNIAADFLAPGEDLCDITDRDSIRRVIGTSKPDIIINCAAYNLVDQAEKERDIAFRVNADGPKYLAEAARDFGVRLVHFSSDYVFDGTKQDGLYTESDMPNPLNEYGKSKYAGEQAVSDILGSNGLVFRLSWVFDAQGKQNFIYKFLERVRENKPLAATCDEFSVPTWTETVVDVVLKAIDSGRSGLYHLTNSGYCSRYEWARMILKVHGMDRFIRPVSMDSFGLPAKRPKFSAMSNASIARELKIEIPSWEEAVESCEAKRGDVK